MKEYYGYSADVLAEKAKLPVRCLPSSEAVFRLLAEEMAECIAEKNAREEDAVIICPVGPVGHYPYFVEMANERRLNLRRCWFINMDEYLTEELDWIDSGHRLSFRGFMDREVYGKIDPGLRPPEARRVFPDPKNPGALTALVDSLGGADLCIGGVGINGHLAFNEPEPALTPAGFAAQTTRVLAISQETRTANAIGDLGGAIEDMPRFAVTIGMREILSAKRMRLGVFRSWHRAVLRRACCSEPSAAFPVTLLQDHPDAMILANDVAAAPVVEL